MDIKGPDGELIKRVYSGSADSSGLSTQRGHEENVDWVSVGGRLIMTSSGVMQRWVILDMPAQPQGPICVLSCADKLPRLADAESISRCTLEHSMTTHPYESPNQRPSNLQLPASESWCLRGEEAAAEGC